MRLTVAACGSCRVPAVSCTRAEADRKLMGLCAGWMHFDRPDRAREVMTALEALRKGAGEVTAMHTIYRIQEAQAS